MSTIDKDELFDMLLTLFAASRRVFTACRLANLEQQVGHNSIGAVISAKLDALASTKNGGTPGDEKRATSRLSPNVLQAEVQLSPRDLRRFAVLETAVNETVKAILSIEKLADRAMSETLQSSPLPLRTVVAILLSASSADKDEIAGELTAIARRESNDMLRIKSMPTHSDHVITHVLSTVFHLRWVYERIQTARDRISALTGEEDTSDRKLFVAVDDYLAGLNFAAIYRHGALLNRPFTITAEKELADIAYTAQSRIEAIIEMLRLMPESFQAICNEGRGERIRRDIDDATMAANAAHRLLVSPLLTVDAKNHD